MSEIKNVSYDLERLIDVAKEAKKLAYAPYSNFKVGTSLLTGDGHVFSGCNVENTTYGLSICAERVVATKAVSEGFQDFKVLVVIGDSKDPITPCGACRQFLLEFDPMMKIIMVGMESRIEMTVTELLPLHFLRKDT